MFGRSKFARTLLKIVEDTIYNYCAQHEVDLKKITKYALKRRRHRHRTLTNGEIGAVSHKTWGIVSQEERPFSSSETLISSASFSKIGLHASWEGVMKSYRLV